MNIDTITQGLTVAGNKGNNNFDPKQINLSALPCVQSNRKKAVKISLFDMVSGFKDESKRERFEKQRSLIDPQKKAKLKCTEFKAFSISVDYHGELTGILTLDLDHISTRYNKTPLEIIEMVCKHFPVLVGAKSIGGDGVFFLIRYPKENNLRAVFNHIEESLDFLLGLELDDLKDAARLRIDTFDENTYINWEAGSYLGCLVEDPKQEAHTPAALSKIDEDKFLIPTTPAEIFNYSGEAGLLLIIELLESKGWTTKKGKAPVHTSFTRPAGQEGSMVAMDNEEIIKFRVHSNNTGLLKTDYNPFDLYKELTGLDNHAAQRALSVLGFGEFHERAEVIGKRSESYSKMIEFVESLDVRLNTLAGVKELNGRPLNDVDVSVLLTRLSLESGKNESKDILLTVLDVVAISKKYDPFLSYVEKLKTMEATDFSKPTEIDKFISCWSGSTDKALIKIYLSRFLLGLFDMSLLDKMTKLVLVLTGAQNSCKTSTGPNLLPQELRPYARNVDFNRNKLVDCKISLCSSLISNFDEFEAIFNHAAPLADFKNVSASKEIFERRPYGRFPEVMKRRSLIMGTSNFGQILTDPTGNSRFCTIDVQSFDLKRYFTVDLDKLWRAVYDLHLSGETSNLTERERAMQTAENQNFEAVDAYSELIEQSFEKSVTGFITATEVMQELEKNTKQHISINKVGAALKKLGFEKGPKRINGTVRKGYNLKYIFFDTE